MRIIIFSGKGGSGTTTMAAATASALAAAGKPTLAFGITKGLGTAFGAEVGLEPSSVAPNLDAVEGHGGHGGPDEFRDWLEALLDWRKMDAELAEDVAALPGVNHMGRLLELELLINSEKYDAIVLDAADFSQFLDLPGALDAASRWLERLFAPRQQTVFEPLFRAIAQDYASAGDDLFETGKDLLTRLADLRELLTDPDVTSTRLVVAPGTTAAAAAAAHEGIAVLSLFGFRVDAVVANRLLPAAVTDSFFASARAAQDKLLKEFTSARGFPAVLRSDLLAKPPAGTSGHATLAAVVYGESSPDDFLSDLTEHAIENVSDHYILRVNVPFARRDDLRLEELDEGIAVHLNGRRCVVTLPEDVKYREASAWSYEDGTLRITLSR